MQFDAPSDIDHSGRFLQQLEDLSTDPRPAQLARPQEHDAALERICRRDVSRLGLELPANPTQGEFLKFLALSWHHGAEALRTLRDGSLL